MTTRDMTYMHTGLPSRPAFPIISHVPNVHFSLGVHGTSFLVRRERAVFLITAKHCLTGTGAGAVDANVGAGNLLIPIPFGRLRHDVPVHAKYMNFREVLTVQSQVKKDEFPGVNGDLDIAVLPVKVESRRAHSALLANAMKLPPTGEWVEKVINSVERNAGLGDLILRAYGFPLTGTATAVEHEQNSVVTQGILLAGIVTGKGPMPHVMTIEFPGAPGSIDLNGMSGGPVMLRLPASEKGRSPDHFIAGMIFRGVYPTLHFVTIRWFVETIDTWLRRHPEELHLRLSR